MEAQKYMDVLLPICNSIMKFMKYLVSTENSRIQEMLRIL